MTARIIDGKAIAAQLRAAVAAETRRLAAARGLVPGLAVILVGENPASKAYVGSKSRAVVEVGMKPFDFHLPATTGANELLGLIGELNADAAVHGILVQLPLPPSIRPKTSTAFIRSMPVGWRQDCRRWRRARRSAASSSPKRCMRR